MPAGGKQGADGLSDKERQFVSEFLVDKNQTQAALRAGYAKSAARVTATKLMKRPPVRAAIEAALQKVAKKAEVTVERIVAEYARIGFADPRKAVAWAGNVVTAKASTELDDDAAACIAEVSQTKDGIRIKFHSKTAALDSLAQHLGMFPNKLELTGAGGGPIEVESPRAEIERRLQRLGAAAKTAKAKK